MRRNKRGFTLIELIIVIIIIGILASIAAPVIRRMKVRSICSEAVTGLAPLRTAFNNYRAEFQAYPNIVPLRWLPNINADLLGALGLTSADFTGRYFSDNCYMLTSSANSFTIYVFTAPEKYTGTVNTSQGGVSGETQGMVDNPANYGLIYVTDTTTAKGKFRQFNISQSGY